MVNLSDALIFDLSRDLFEFIIIFLSDHFTFFRYYFDFLAVDIIFFRRDHYH